MTFLLTSYNPPQNTHARFSTANGSTILSHVLWALTASMSVFSSNTYTNTQTFCNLLKSQTQSNLPRGMLQSTDWHVTLMQAPTGPRAAPTPGSTGPLGPRVLEEYTDIEPRVYYCPTLPVSRDLASIIVPHCPYRGI